MLLGVGADFDIRPDLRVSTNANYLAFAETEVLETVRNQGSLSNSIGYDLSAAIIWRPFDNQNLILRASGAALVVADGLQELLANDQEPGGIDDDVLYSILGNIIVTY